MRAKEEARTAIPDTECVQRGNHDDNERRIQTRDDETSSKHKSLRPHTCVLDRTVRRVHGDRMRAGTAYLRSTQGLRLG